MIAFNCLNCGTPYVVPDAKAGKRARCPKCGKMVTVPTQLSFEEPEAPADTERRASPTPPSSRPRQQPWTKVAVSAGIILGTLAIAVTTYLLLKPNPTREEVRERLLKQLPPGYTKFDIEEYDRGSGRLQFSVSYMEAGDPVAVDYRAIRSYSAKSIRGGKGWLVEVTGRRPQFDRPFEKWLMVEALCESDGRMAWKREPTAAGPGEGPVYEQRARAIALAVHGAF